MLRPDYRSREYRRQKTNDHLPDSYPFYSKGSIQENRLQESRQEVRPQDRQEGRQEVHQEGRQEDHHQEGCYQMKLSSE
jgi:hypothetical protein